MTGFTPRRTIALGLLLALSPTMYAFPKQEPAKPPNQADTSIPGQHLVQPEELVALLRTQPSPFILQVGPHALYTKGHLPGALYAEPAGTEEGARALRARVARLPKNLPILLYCGCCPWDRCPNIHPAYQILRSLGFTNVKVLYLPGNFVMDWMRKGYPVATGG